MPAAAGNYAVAVFDGSSTTATLRDNGTVPAVAWARRGLSHEDLKAEILHMYRVGL